MFLRRVAAPAGVVRRIGSSGVRSFAAPVASNDGVAVKKDDASKRYQATLHLPQTAFPMRPKADWDASVRSRISVDLYRWQTEARASDKEPFVLHDGPPYANGRPHLGHALNKILKDFVLRHELMRGRRVHFMPGWDCHGLPIELKALEAVLPGTSSTATPSPLDIRARARSFALRALDEQRDEMREWGLLADLDGLIYRTLDPSYESAQLQVFASLVARGVIFRAHRPVYWSPATRTALAEAELEYNDDHVSRVVHVAYPLKDEPNTDLVIWTTTPWTLPANRAIAVNPDLEYVKLAHPATGRDLLIARALAPSVAPTLGLTITPDDIAALPAVLGATLAGREYSDPFAAPGDARRIITGDHVTSDAGTGLVHTAPAHGLDDFIACKRAGVRVTSADCFVDDQGRYSSAAPAGLAGLRVMPEGNEAVISALGGRVLHQGHYKHRYPYDWRARQPVIVRATEQWFCRLDDGVARDARSALASVTAVPASSKHRLETMLAGRDDWCISRQRVWGVPIPAFFHVDGKEPPLLTPESISHVAKVVGAHPDGSDAWWTLPLSELLPPSHAHRASEFRRGEDTMDVWFDSGASWATLLRTLDGESKVAEDKRKADVYLEGSDQHRGWFQSSLLTSVAVRGTAPYSKLITHGFVLDEAGRKMSKSLGNVVEPRAVISGSIMAPAPPTGKQQKQAKSQAKSQLKPQAGGGSADLLRLWAASTEYSGDVVIGPTIISKVAESLRKLRNTSRFMLGNLFDMTPEKALPYDQLLATDRYMISLLHDFRLATSKAYNVHHYNGVYSHLAHLCSTTLSGFYFEAVKGRLYTAGENSQSRRAAQTTLTAILHTLTRVMAPITAHLSEEVFDAYRHALPPNDAEKRSVFMLTWPSDADDLAGGSRDDALVGEFELLMEARGQANRQLDALRKSGEIKSSQEAVVVFNGKVGGALTSAMQKHKEELAALFGVASVEVREGGEEEVEVKRSTMEKCPRCWNYAAREKDVLCGECESVVSK